MLLLFRFAIGSRIVRSLCFGSVVNLKIGSGTANSMARAGKTHPTGTLSKKGTPSMGWSVLKKAIKGY
jgi:hypothetical protein